MKYIKIKSCKDCPYILQIACKAFCKKENVIINDINKIANFCGLKDCPKTISEYLGNKI